MIPEEVFKRRHYGTPESFSLITANYVILALLMTIYGTVAMHWSFWLFIGILLLYNVNVIRRNRDEFRGGKMIGYMISIVGLAGMFLLFRYGTHR